MKKHLRCIIALSLGSVALPSGAWSQAAAPNGSQSAAPTGAQSLRAAAGVAVDPNAGPEELSAEIGQAFSGGDQKSASAVRATDGTKDGDAAAAAMRPNLKKHPAVPPVNEDLLSVGSMHNDAHSVAGHGLGISGDTVARGVVAGSLGGLIASYLLSSTPAGIAVGLALGIWAGYDNWNNTDRIEQSERNARP